jgi:hypothetical protein
MDNRESSTIGDEEGMDEEEEEEASVDLDNVCDPPPQPPRRLARFANVQRAVNRKKRRVCVPQTQDSAIRVPSSFELVEGVPSRTR